MRSSCLELAKLFGDFHTTMLTPGGRFCLVTKSSLWTILIISLTATPFSTYQPHTMALATASAQPCLSQDSSCQESGCADPASKLTSSVADVQPENYWKQHPEYFDEDKRRRARTSEEILLRVDPDAEKHCKKIIASSISSDTAHRDLVPNSNGFIDAVLRAYGGHFHLEIRPDDVWITILTQFSMFVNANAERFRYKFVSFEGKQTLRIVVDMLTSGEIAVEMGKLLQENIVDPDLREWIVPHFTTTTAEDTIVSSVIMMATLKEYFDYEAHYICGIPSVTLHGEKKDWETLYRKIQKLKEFGLETTMWYHLLEPILGRFVRAWDDPDGEWNKQFWTRVATTHNHGGFCGPPPDLTGWITAFMPFDDKGKWQLYDALPHLRAKDDSYIDYLDDDDDDDDDNLPSARENHAHDHNPSTLPAQGFGVQQPRDIVKGDTQTTSSDTDPVSLENDESYKNLTRHELMIKYNSAAQEYANSTDGNHIDDTQHKPKYTVLHSGFGIEVLALYTWGVRWDYRTEKEQREYIFRSTMLVIDGAWYPKHPQDQIPRAVVNVPVRVFEQGRKFESQLVAGVMGFDVTQVPKSNGNEPEPVATTPARMQPEPYYPHLDNAEKSAEVSCGPYDAWDITAGYPQCLNDATDNFESILKPRVGWWFYEMRTPEE
ncbi:hypothetical protein BDZ91DRAFT_745141 [Kalaharituber pfeilii]|nr:hypothetical protein BDZ91DRAFT_745141 [Kalaharituber pfeilii]